VYFRHDRRGDIPRATAAQPDRHRDISLSSIPNWADAVEPTPSAWDLTGCGTRPWPVLRNQAQPGFYRILFDVPCNALFFVRVSNPPVEIVPRPKLPACPVQQPIGIPPAAGFDSRNDLGQIGSWPEHDRNMMHQPSGTSCDGIRQAIPSSDELRAFRAPAIGGYVQWQRTIETPCQEVRGAFLLPVRKSAMILRPHKSMVS